MMLEIVDGYSRDFKVKFGGDKSKVMVINGDETDRDREWNIGEVKIGRTKEYKYLGCMWSEDGCTRAKGEKVVKSMQWWGRLSSVAKYRANKCECVRGIWKYVAVPNIMFGINVMAWNGGDLEKLEVLQNRVGRLALDLDSLERRNCCDVFPQRDGDSISTKSECELEMSGSIDDLKVNFTINDGDGQMDLTHEQQCKIEKITAVLKKPILDVSVLQQFAEEDDGFVTDELRREVWPCLILMQESKPPLLLTLQQAQLHPSFSQVVMDVERTLKRFPPNISPERRRTLMDELIRVIMTVLQRNPLFHYYQGYHDVGITFLLVCGEQTAVQLLEELSLTHLREFLQPTMERTQRWLTYIYPMIAAESPALYAHMDQSGVGTMFCLPWLITWYAHSLSQYRHVVRLYDFLLASPPLMPMYVAGVILLQRKQQLLDVPCDMPMLHQALSSIPDSIPLDKIFREARLLYKRRPPSSLSEEVDRYLLRQKEREEAERAERDRRVAARKSGAAGARPWWLPYSVMRPGRIWVRAAGAVAVVAVVLGLASFYFRPENKLLLPVQWSTERPISAPQ
ncbi:Rab-GTPase-TBC domain [Trinorchestia longiramus]|nr:Rab-GTPase-TBC domain [Trinorchestia longiramus]